MLLFTQQEIFILFWNARDRPHAKDFFLLSKLGKLIRTTLTKTYLKLCIYHTNCISWAVTEDNMMLQHLGKINLCLNTGAIALSHTSPLKDTREHRCAKGFCSLQLLMDCLAHQPQTNSLLEGIKPTLPHRGLRVSLKTQKHLRSQKNCAMIPRPFWWCVKLRRLLGWWRTEMTKPCLLLCQGMEPLWKENI